jgi:hypothetical protein
LQDDLPKHYPLANHDAHICPTNAGLVGVDISPYLIEVAQRHFALSTNYRFYLDEVVPYVMHARYCTLYEDIDLRRTRRNR